MLQPNRAAAEVFARLGVAACTDVTGFGLAGHLLEMLDASGVGGTLYADRVPLLAGFREVVAAGIVSTLHRDNAKSACRFTGPESPPALLFDPQTGGGLLAAVPADQVDAVLSELRTVGYSEAATIGQVVVTEGGGPSITMRTDDVDPSRGVRSSPNV
jgi:selenide,water dikinase